MTYTPPLDDMILALRAGAGFDQACTDGVLGDCDTDLVEPVLEEAGKIASGLVAPLNRQGDIIGAKLNGHDVAMPPGWREAYRQWREGGWNGLSSPEAFGGQGLPHVLNAPCLEMWGAASMAFCLCPMLTHGAIDAILAHGSDELQQLYLPKLISGEWTGTMLLTEPQAGSDVGALRTSAEPLGDGTYRLKGTKIYITFGEHDLSDNIIHLVLARLPGAPAGTRGISLFLVPKFLLNADGSPGKRNDIFAASLEHKLGIHASPTCVMNLGDGDGAIGYLIGEENRGMSCMFSMMNQTRLGVGLQGVGVAERATQKALSYARERVQGRAPGSKSNASDPIIAHPDVQRMLMLMHALTAAARAICYATALAHDISGRADDKAVADAAAARNALLTPMAKAFSTDIANEVTSLGVQVHGGMGYIEETGAAQLMRDVRIAAIYEGTNGIQAIDLLTRKIAPDDGAALGALLGELRAAADAASNHADLKDAAAQVRAALEIFERTARAIAARLASDASGALGGATPLLRLASIAIGGGLLLKMANAATADSSKPARGARMAALVRFYAATVLADCEGLAAATLSAAEAMTGAKAVLDLA